MTSLPSLLLTISCGMVLWEWPSSTASRPVVLAMTSVERHGSEDSVDTEVCDGHDVVGAVLLRGVNGLLHGVVQVLTVVALGEGIDVVAVLVLEVGRRGLHEALRGADADDGRPSCCRRSRWHRASHRRGGARPVWQSCRTGTDTLRPGRWCRAADHAVVKLMVPNVA